jgi:flagellar hook-associated protein 1 FlgK
VPGFGSILSIARTAIAAQQTAVQVVSQNVANAETEGYSRQRAELAAATPQRFGFGSLGTGVQVQNVVRLRDAFLDNNYRTEAANAEGFGLRRDVLTQVEGIFGEPSDQSLSGALDAFWSSWSDLANNPGTPSAQAVVRQRGIEVASTLNRFASRLSDLEATNRSRLSSTVDEVNRLGGQLAELNGQITAAETGGTMAPDLRDARDRIADQLAKLGGARMMEQSNGTMSFVIGGVTVVDGTTARTIEVRPGIPTAIGLVGATDPLPPSTGTLGAMATLLNVDIPGIRAKLDGLAKGTRQRGELPAHERLDRGWRRTRQCQLERGHAADRFAREFLQSCQRHRRVHRLSAEVSASAAVIASGSSQNAPGDNALALSIGSLRDTTGIASLQTAMGAAAFAAQVGLTSGESYNDTYRNAVTNVGLQVRAADRLGDRLGNAHESG